MLTQGRRRETIFFKQCEASTLQSDDAATKSAICLCAAVRIDPEISPIDRYLDLAAREGLRIHYLIDTHAHADHDGSRPGGELTARTFRDRVGATHLCGVIVPKSPLVSPLGPAEKNSVSELDALPPPSVMSHNPSMTSGLP